MTSELTLQPMPRPSRQLADLAGRGFDRLAGRDLALYQAAIVRIGIVSVYLLFLLREFPHRSEVWGDRSPWTPDLAKRMLAQDGGFSLLLWSPDRWWLDSLYLLTVVTGLLVVLGWRTRWCLAVFTVLMLSFQFRASTMSDGGDNVIQLLILYLVFTRCGRVWSLDARRHARRDPQASTSGPAWLSEGRLVADRIGTVVHNCAMFVIAAQVCVLYATAGLNKVQGPMWQDGTALWYALKLDYLRPLPALNDAIVSHSMVVLGLCYLTVFTQIAFPFCVFHRRAKNCLLLVLIVEHLGIALMMGLPFFSLAIIAADLVFLPTALLLMSATRVRAAGSWLRTLGPAPT